MADKLILGQDAIYSTDSNITGLNNNVIVCGTSGCGKTMSITEPRLLQTYETSLITTVTKRRIVDKYKPLLESRGYTVMDLNFINPTKSTVSYDPLSYVSSYADIKFLANSVVMANPRKDQSKQDPYWDESAVSLLSAEIAYTLATVDKPSFADVLELHDSISFSERSDSIKTNLDQKFDELAKADPGNYAISCWKTFRQLPMRTASCIFSTLNSAIDAMFTPELRKMMKKKQNIRFEDIAKEKTVLFVSTSAVNPALNCFINMFYSQAFKSLFEFAEKQPDGKLPIGVHVLCDDFATGSRILNFPEYISIFREKQISVTLLIQSESQLESMYDGNDATTIINNCDTYLYMGGMDLKTGSSVSQRLNAPLDEVLYMPIGDMVIFRRGQKPIRTKRYNILEDDLYLQVTKAYEESIAASR